MDLKGHKIILASGSPRRRELLGGLDLPFETDTENNFIESINPELEPHEVPVAMSKGKSHGFHRALRPEEILITSDTVVIVTDGSGCRQVLGKPSGPEGAKAMLKLLSGKTHEVVTAVTIRTCNKEKTFTDSTFVTFNNLSDSEMGYYIEKYRPFDKAGAYGVQEWIGYVAISRLEGSFYNVMGFPVHKVWAELKQFIG